MRSPGNPTRSLATLLTAIVAATLAGACTTRSRGDASGSAPNSPAALEERVRAFSRAVVGASASGWADREVEALTAFYTEEAVVFPPRGDPLRGREALRVYWTRPADRRILEHVVRPERIDVDGGLAAEHGWFMLTFQAGSNAPARDSARYVSIWRRGGDGLWRKQLDTWW